MVSAYRGDEGDVCPFLLLWVAVGGGRVGVGGCIEAGLVALVGDATAFVGGGGSG